VKVVVAVGEVLLEDLILGRIQKIKVTIRDKTAGNY
jgi:hypothetical protein